MAGPAASADRPGSRPSGVAAEAPICQAIGAPLDFIPLWIAVFAIPDIFVTVCNVTANLGFVTMIRRRTVGAAV